MLWVLSTAGLTGLLCGCLFRAPALVFVSFLSFGGGFVVMLIGDASFGSAVVTAFLLTAALQCGYLLGAALCHLRHQIRSRLQRDGGLGSEFRHSLRRASREPLPHR